MRRQRVLLTLAAVVIGLVVLQQPAEASARTPATAIGAEVEDTTPARSEPIVDPQESDVADERARRATWIAFGMVVAALAVGGLLVFSGRAT